jgi:hypothetical protein
MNVGLAMLAYIFWHVPLPRISPSDYEAALLGFQRDLATMPPQGLASCATYQISGVPWLDGGSGYEDWYFIDSSAALDALNEAAVAPLRRGVHAAIASKMDFGHGGLYRHVFGEEQPLGGRVVWLRRPRGIDYEPVLRGIADGSSGFLSCWRRQMVLGPADEFAVIGTSSLVFAIPQGWRGRTVERRMLAPSPIA